MCQPAQRAAIIAPPSRPVNLYFEEIPIRVFAFVFLGERFHLALIVKVFRARGAEQQGTVNVALTVKGTTTVVALPAVFVGHGLIIPFFFPTGQLSLPLFFCGVRTRDATKLVLPPRIADELDVKENNILVADFALDQEFVGHGGIVPFFFSCRQLPLTHLLPHLPLGALDPPLQVALGTLRAEEHLAAALLRDLVHGDIIDDLQARWKRLTIFFILLFYFPDLL